MLLLIFINTPLRNSQTKKQNPRIDKSRIISMMVYIQMKKFLDSLHFYYYYYNELHYSRKFPKGKYYKIIQVK